MSIIPVKILKMLITGAQLVGIYKSARRTNNKIEAYHRYLPTTMLDEGGRRPRT